MKDFNLPSLINHIPSPQCGHKKTKASSDQATENHQSQVLLDQGMFLTDKVPDWKKVFVKENSNIAVHKKDEAWFTGM